MMEWIVSVTSRAAKGSVGVSTVQGMDTMQKNPRIYPMFVRRTLAI